MGFSWISQVNMMGILPKSEVNQGIFQPWMTRVGNYGMSTWELR